MAGRARALSSLVVASGGGRPSTPLTTLRDAAYGAVAVVAAVAAAVAAQPSVSAAATAATAAAQAVCDAALRAMQRVAAQLARAGRSPPAQGEVADPILLGADDDGASLVSSVDSYGSLVGRAASPQQQSQLREANLRRFRLAPQRYGSDLGDIVAMPADTPAPAYDSRGGAAPPPVARPLPPPFLLDAEGAGEEDHISYDDGGGGAAADGADGGAASDSTPGDA
eukprot:gene9976-832_t